jgi:hypothetical protein
MSFTLKGGLYIEKAATDMMVAMNTEEAMAEGWLRPVFWRRRNTDQMSGLYRQQDIDDQLRIYDTEVAFAGQQDQMPESTFELGENIPFSNRPFAIEAVIDYVEQAASDAVINYASRVTQDATFKFFNSMEGYAITTLRDPSKLTQSIALSNAERLDNYASTKSNPIALGIAAILMMKQDTGKSPNVIAIDDIVWKWGFELHPNAISRSPVQVPMSVQGAGGQLTVELLEKLWRVEPGTIRIYEKRYNPGRKGFPKQRKSHLGSDIVFAYVEDPNLSSTGFGHEVSFTGLGELPSDYPFAVLTYEDPKRGLYGSQRVRICAIANWIVTRPQSAVRVTNTLDLTDTRYMYISPTDGQPYPILD